MLKNYVALVLDESGSMGGLNKKVRQLVDAAVQAFRQSDIDYGQKTFISIVKFSNRSNIICANVPVTNDIGKLLSYYPSGGTALWDGFGTAVNLIADKVSEEDSAGIISVITDGEENSSQNYSANDIKKTISNKQKQGNWTFTFQVPSSGYSYLVNNFGISRDNVQAWEATEQGMEVATQSNARGYTNYAASRSKGLTSVQSFYADVDLSDLKSKDVKAALHDVKNDFIILDVTYEDNIKNYVNDNSSVSYNKGCAAYQLSKKETIQHYKDIYVREKNKSAIYSGAQARQLIGLPIGANAKVNPVDLSKYEVYVVSTSVNRKLVPGTKLLVRK